jgi:glucans biosynthesis protein C
MNMPTTRRLDLDWLRIAAFGLLIAYHVGMYYVTWGFHIKSPFASHAIEPLMLVLNPWRLSLLFFISGSAAAFLLRDVAASQLPRVAAKRSRFLLVPVVFGMLLIVPPQCHWGSCSVFPTWNHLWFVVYLWVYTMLLIAARSLIDRLRLARWQLLVLPWLWLAFARIVLLPHFKPTHALVDDWYDHAQYLPVFVIGYIAARDEGVWRFMTACRWWTLGLAIVGYGFLRVPAYYALMQWAAILAVLGWARHLLGSLRDTPARAYLTDAVFCYYIVHQTIIIGVADALRPLALQPAVEGPLLMLITAAGCAASYEIARRLPLLRPLFGIRRGRISLRADGVSRHPTPVSS